MFSGIRSLVLLLLISSCNPESDPPTDAKDIGLVGDECRTNDDCLAGLECFPVGQTRVCSFRCAPVNGRCDISGICTKVGTLQLCLPQ